MFSVFWLAVGAMIISGVAVATQGPINAQLAKSIGDPLIASMGSFAIGFFLLLAVNLARGGFQLLDGSILSVPPWLWLGGLCGVWIVCAAVFSVPVIGALTALAALILGQLMAGLAIDASGAFGLPQRPVEWHRLAAVLCVGAGVYLSRI